VIMTWVGVSTFAAAMNGHVMMLDGFLAYGRSGTWGNNADYVGETVRSVTSSHFVPRLRSTRAP